MAASLKTNLYTQSDKSIQILWFFEAKKIEFHGPWLPKAKTNTLAQCALSMLLAGWKFVIRTASSDRSEAISSRMFHKGWSIRVFTWSRIWTTNNTLSTLSRCSWTNNSNYPVDLCRVYLPSTDSHYRAIPASDYCHPFQKMQSNTFILFF